MKKIAILISGEFRNFNITKKTIPILEDSRVSVFVSTWSNVDTTLFKNVIISEEIIKSYFQKPPIQIIIDDYEKLNNKQFFPIPMINRWISGFKMIDDSYDVVLIMRPDLFFNPDRPITFDDIVDCNDVIKFINLLDSIKQGGNLPDLGFCAEYNVLKELLNNLDHDWMEWRNSTKGWKKWHFWWFDYVSKHMRSEKIIALQDNLIPICRDWCNEGHSFKEVENIHNDFFYYKVIENINKYGVNTAMAPDTALFVKALNLYKSGYFDKYNIEKNLVLKP